MQFLVSSGSRTRCLLTVALAVLPSVFPAGLMAQDDLTGLRKRMKAGDAAGVLDRVRDLVAGGEGTVEMALLGAEAALTLREWGQAGSLGSLATSLSRDPETRRPTEHRGFEMEAHALWGSAQEAIASGRVSGLTRASFMDAASFYRESRAHGGDPFESGFWEAQACRFGLAFDEALLAIELALEAEPDNWAARVLKGRILIDLKRNADAVAHFRALRAANERDPEVAHLLLAAALGTDDRRAIRATFLELIRAFPGDMALYRPFHGRFSADDDPGYLESTLRAVAEFHPVTRDRVPRFYLALAAERGERLEEALELMVAYRDAAPTTPEGPYQVARLLLRLGRRAEAHQQMLKASALGGLEDADMARGFGLVIAAHVGANDYRPAVALQRIVVGMAADANAELNLARLLYHDGKRDEAIGIVKRLLQREDGHEDGFIAELYNDLALYHLGLGQDKEAEACLRRSMAASEEAMDARENLGIFLIQRGREAEGVKLLEQCLSRSPERHRSRYHLLRRRHPEVLGGGG